MCNNDHGQKMIEADKAIRFLNDHPALHRGGGSFFDNNFSFWISHVCANGEALDYHDKAELMEVRVHHGHASFNALFDKYKCLEDGDDINDLDCYITVPYHEVYGCEWKHAKSIYTGEYMLVKYDGTTPEDVMDYWNWMNYHGGMIRADNFEDLLIMIGKEVKALYGEFDSVSFLTEAEKENHVTEHPYTFAKSEETDPIPFAPSIPNPKYIEIPEGELNLRWWKWYAETDHYKKNWKEDF